MKSEGVSKQVLPFADISVKQMVQIAIISIVGGMVLWLLGYALSEFVFKGFCAPDAGICADAKQYASATATVVVAAIILFGFVKLAVFRPLLIVIAATISLWGLLSYLGGLIPATAILVSGLAYGLAFLAFTWLARIKLFWLSLLCTVLLVIAMRFILTS